MTPMFVARDEDGRLFLYGGEPRRIHNHRGFAWTGGACMALPGELFPDLSYLDSPMKVKIIKDNGRDSETRTGAGDASREETPGEEKVRPAGEP